MSRTIIDNPTSSLKVFLNNATLMGLHKNKKFLGKLFDKGTLTIKNAQESDLEKVKSDFFAILDLFEEKYKGQADLGFYSVGELQFVPYFKVIYPQFTITNSNGRTHEIRDLLVCHFFSFRNGSVHPSGLEGGRISKTNLEVLSGYQQSHLGSHSTWVDNPFYVSKFCVGGDTDVSRMLAEFEVEMNIDRYELFLFCVDSMVTWESLEGVPYIRMEVIQNVGSSRVYTSYAGQEDAVISKIISNKIPLDFDFYISDGVYRINPNLKASNLIKKVVLENLLFATAKNIIVTKLPNTYDSFQQMKSDSDTAVQLTKINAVTEYIIFRGKKVYPRIIREDARKKASVSIEDHIVYPKFLKNVLRKLESRIYEKAVVKNATRLYYTSSDAHRGVTSDTVSL